MAKFFAFQRNKYFLVIFLLLLSADNVHAIPQVEEGWRWKNTFNFTYGGAALPAAFNPDNIHNDMRSYESVLSNNLQTNRQNIALAKISLCGHNAAGALQCVTEWIKTPANNVIAFRSGGFNGQRNGNGFRIAGVRSHICHVNPPVAPAAIVAAAPPAGYTTFQIMGLDDVVGGVVNRQRMSNWYAHLVNKFVPPAFLSPQQHLNRLHDALTPAPIVLPAPAPAIGVPVAPAVAVPKGIAAFNAQNYFHSEQWAMLYFAIDFSRIINNLINRYQAIHGAVAPFVPGLLILHIHSNRDPCRICSETLSMFSMFMDQIVRPLAAAVWLPGVPAPPLPLPVNQLRTAIQNGNIKLLVTASSRTRLHANRRGNCGHDVNIAAAASIAVPPAAGGAPPPWRAANTFPPYHAHKALTPPPLPAMAPAYTPLPPI